MKRNEVIQARKNEALNEITKIYHPLYKFPYKGSSSLYFEDIDSHSEQREREISYIISNMKRDIKEIKKRFKEEDELRSRNRPDGNNVKKVSVNLEK